VRVDLSTEGEVKERAIFLRNAFLDHATISMRRVRLRPLRRSTFTSLRRRMRRAEYRPCFSRLVLPKGAPRGRPVLMPN